MATATQSPAVRTEVQMAQDDALVQLARLAGVRNNDDDITFEGSRYVLPSTTNLKGAIDFLIRKQEEMEMETSYHRQFLYRPYDGGHATMLAIREAFGFGVAKPIMTFFGPRPPAIVSVPTGVNESVQVPWGAMALPGLDNTTVTTGADEHPEFGMVFSIRVTGPRKYRNIIEGFFNLVQSKLETNSIYRGKAIDGQADMPQFLELGGVDPDNVVYTAETMQQLEANVWAPIRYANELEALGISGKRAILFEGPYGTGKTLAAFLTAKEAVAHGWTFLMCRPGRDNFQQVMQTARLYQPCVVFFEDIDIAADATEGADEMSQMLDLFDGIQSKGTKIIAVLTTNHVESIHKGMLRPGRLDAVIHVGAMDRNGVERLARRVLGDNLDADIDFDEVFAAMTGFMPAFVREALDRTVRYSISRNNGQMSTVSTSDLVGAAAGLRTQLDLMNGAGETPNATTIESRFDEILNRTISGTRVMRGREQFALLAANSD
jgi:transitional endoplasmic reticulum ATPase